MSEHMFLWYMQREHADVAAALLYIESKKKYIVCVNVWHAVSPSHARTSPVAVAEVRKPPHVGQIDRKPDDGQQEVGVWTPRLSARVVIWIQDHFGLQPAAALVAAHLQQFCNTTRARSSRDSHI